VGVIDEKYIAVGNMITIVMPLLNVSPYFYQALEAVKANTKIDHEVIVIHSNGSFSQNCNRGIKASNGEYICLLNDDTIVQPGWLENMVRCAEETGAGIVGCKMTAGNLNWRKLDKNDPICNNRREFQAVTFGCVLIKREVVEKVGLLDENYKVGSFEDVDFCHQARRAGFKIFYEPTAEVVHFEAVTMNSLPHGLVKRMHWDNYEYYKNKWCESYEKGEIIVDDQEEIQ